MNLLRVDHTAVAVRDLDGAIARYRDTLGLDASDRALISEQHVEVAFLVIGDTKIELISPTRPDTGVSRFLDRKGEGLHHIGIQVEDIRRELLDLEGQGIELIDREPRRGPHGLIAFVHPRAAGGVLIELMEHIEDEMLQA